MSVLNKLSVAASIADFSVKKFFNDLLSVATVAATGSLISDAAVLSAGRNVVTAANGTKAVRLPKSEVDTMVEIVNTVSNQTLIVFPELAADQINAITAGSAFSLVGGARGAFFCDAPGHWYVAAANLTGTSTSATTAELDKNAGVTAGTATASKTAVLGATKNLDTLRIALVSVGAAGVEDTITAHSGGTQAAALALSAAASVHNVTVVAAGNDSVKLPAATGSGDVHIVKNSAAANSLQLYGTGTDTIDAVATATGVAVAAGKSRLCVDTAAGLWQSLYGA